MRRILVLFTLLLCLAVTAAAQSGRQLIVTVLDPTDQSVPGATVTIEQGATSQTLTTDANGQAVTMSIAAGTYRVTATLSGFTDAPPVTVRVAGNQPTRATVHLGVVRLSDSVTVAGGSDRPPADTAVDTSSLAPEGAADDEILQNTIDAVAGIGSIVRVDGLSSGGLPPAATIQQIRIRQNSFDAEYHEATPAFVEIITNSKPQPWQVNFTTWDRPEAAQARNAFAVEGTPAAQRGGANFNGTGNIRNRASVSFFGNLNSGKEDQPIYAQTPSGPVRGLVDNASQYRYGTLRIGLDKWRNNDLRFESDYQEFRNLNVGAGGFNLAERGYDRDQTVVRARTFWTKPLRKGGSQIFRVQIQRRSETDTPASTAPAIVVLNAFSSGGAQYQGARVDTQLEATDVVTLPVGTKQVWRGGMALWHAGYDSSLTTNAGGTYTFSSLDAYTAGTPMTYTQRIGAGVCCFGVTQFSLWAQDDIAMSKTVSLSLGLRQESETRVSRAMNLAPRGQIDWSPVHVPHTTFHLGGGVFNAWLQPNDIEQTVRVDGIHQQDLLIVDPSYPTPNAGTGGAPLPSGRYLLSPDLTLPRILRSSIGVDHTHGPVTLHADFAHQTADQFRGSNLNAPSADGVRPDPAFGNVVQVESTGRSRLNALTTSVQFNDQKRGASLRMNYTFAYAEDNSDGAFFLPVNALQPDAEWGPGSNDARHRLSGYFSAPLWHRRIAAQTYWQFNSATPYTVTTGVDSNGDGIFNERPLGVDRNGSRGFAQFYQGAHVGWNLPKGVAPPGMPPKYRMQIWIEGDNLWNRVNRTVISSVLSSPYFGQAIAASSPRRLYFGVSATL